METTKTTMSPGQKEKLIKWTIDPAHSEMQFKVKHLMITNVTGSFSKFDADITTEGEDFTTAKAIVKVDTSSVTTGNAQRDGHMKSPDFFDPEKYPDMIFKSTGVERIDNDKYKLLGELTIKEITKPIKLDVEYGGLEKDPWGNLKAGFSLTAKINRKDWGLNWNAALESGGVLVSDDVRILCEVQLVKQA
jgi:polyisoprenoid-binding protein YceI